MTRVGSQRHRRNKKKKEYLYFSTNCVHVFHIISFVIAITFLSIVTRVVTLMETTCDPRERHAVEHTVMISGCTLAHAVYMLQLGLCPGYSCFFCCYNSTNVP
jgi:hypothetical protein